MPTTEYGVERKKKKKPFLLCQIGEIRNNLECEFIIK